MPSYSSPSAGILLLVSRKRRATSRSCRVNRSHVRRGPSSKYHYSAQIHGQQKESSLQLNPKGSFPQRISKTMENGIPEPCRDRAGVALSVFSQWPTHLISTWNNVSLQFVVLQYVDSNTRLGAKEISSVASDGAEWHQPPPPMLDVAVPNRGRSFPTPAASSSSSRMEAGDKETPRASAGSCLWRARARP